MTSRRHILNTTMAVGVLIGIGLVAWSVAGPERGETIPARPDAVAIQVGAIPTAKEPLPRIRVPELAPQPLPEPGSSGTNIHVPSRPGLVLVDLSVDPIQEPMPGIAVPELKRPCALRPPTVRA